MRYLIVKRSRSALVALISLSLVAGTANFVPEARAAKPSRPAPAVQQEKPTPGKEVRPTPVADRAIEQAAAAEVAPAEPIWPTTSTTVTTAGATPNANPVSIEPVQAPRGASYPAPTVQVDVLGQSDSARLGVAGVVLRLSRTDVQAQATKVKVKVAYDKFATAFGGDWATRLRLTELTCDVGGCHQSRVLPDSRNDLQSKTVTAELDLPERLAGPRAMDAGFTTLALTAGVSGSAGSYAATSLSPSSVWNVGSQTGDFTWNYPLRVPPGTAGPKPELSIAYSSGSVDGQVASTNNQTSWVGQGHALEPGFIERKYVSCADDMAGSNTTVKTGDLCWKTDNAVLSLGGHSGELIKISTDATNKIDTFKLKNDDGTQVQRRYGATNGAREGEYWIVTTTDGTKYYFGINPSLPGSNRANSVNTVPVFGNQAGEPCHTSAFATSYCTQAWRWNVDRVVDLSNNLMSYWYVQENNYYGRNNNTGVSLYQRASYPWIIDYGKVAGPNETTSAAAVRVWFTVGERCVPSGTVTCDPAQLTAANASNWPDTPFDQICTSSTSCPNRTSPSFFTRKRLATINTGVLKGSGYSAVDTWTLTQDYPTSGDTNRSLFLRSITHQGKVGGALTNPAVTFAQVDKPNRVDAIGDGAPAMYKFRVGSITSESGQITNVNYSAADCTPTSKPANPATSTRRCFPVYWTIDGGTEPTMHWFHKYVVTSVVVDDGSGGGPDQSTTYDYLGTPAWHFDDNELTLPKYRTWSDWRGYGKVDVKVGPTGNQSRTQYTFFRGMHDDYLDKAGTTRKTSIVTDSQGDTVEDANRYNGYVREQIAYDGASGPEVTGTINMPWVKATGSAGGETSMLLRTASSTTRTRLSSGSYRLAGTSTSFDDLGMPTAVDDHGDLATNADDRCTRYTYNRNAGIWLLDSVSREQQASLRCSVEPSQADQIISDLRTYFDDSTSLTAAPVRGLITKVESLDDTESGPAYVQRSRTVYDSLGRVLETYDGLNRRTSKVTFTPATGGPVTGTATEDAKGFVSSSIIDPSWGATVAEVDPNGRRTDLTYDAFGRLTGVWLPNRSKAGGATASMIFSYLVSKTAPNVVATQELKPDGTYKISRTLLDGLLRRRQVQTPGANGGRVIADTTYDARGNVATEEGPYFDNTSVPTNTLFDADEPNLPARQIYTYDGANRVIASAFVSQATEKWRTQTVYGGNAVATIPPEGGTTTIQMLDARGKATELRQFHGRAAGGEYDSTKYEYTPDNQLASVTNPSGSVWQYTYDRRGRQISVNDPDKGTTTSSYDAADRLTSTKDARGQELFFSYDELDRKTAVRSGSAAGPTLASWLYDTLGKGLLTSSTRTVDGNNYVSAITGYDAMDRPTGSQVTIPASEGKLAGTYTSSTSYNPDGTVRKAVLPSTPGLPDESIDLYYDDAGYLKAMLGWQAYVSGTKRGNYGEPLQYHMGQKTGLGVFQSFVYEEGSRRLTQMKVDREAVLETDDTFDYAYDDAANVTSISHKYGTSTDLQCFGHDYLRRTTEAWTPATTCGATRSAAALGGPAPYWQSYTYDDAGDRTKLIDHRPAGDTTTTYTYPAAGAARPHGVTAVNSSGPSGTSVDNYGYDAVGNMSTRTVGGDTDTLTWDPEGHLASVSGPDGDTSYVYDADGSRLIRHDPKGATLYLASAEVRWDKAADSVSSTRYYDFDGSTVAMRNNSQSVEYLIADPQGTATVSVDGLSAVVSRRSMDPFGNSRGTTSPTWELNSRGFVNGVDDPSTGLTHLGAREYDPKLGRFISVDPLVDVADPQTLNGYRYGNNNPSTFSDPDGLMEKEESYHNGETADWTDEEFQHWLDTKEEPDRTVKKREEREQVQKITKHREAKEQAKKKIKKVIKDLVKIVADELGVTDALNCFTNGDVGACVATGVTVLSSFAGGIAGKLISKYLLHAKRAWKLIGRIKELVGEAIDGIKGLRKAEDELKAASCVANSFVPGTLVLLANGTRKPIEQVKLGDKVLATDPTTGLSSAQPVIRTIIGHGTKDLVDVQVAASGSGGVTKSGIVTATAGHRFYLPLLNRWVDAGDLVAGDRLASAGSHQAMRVSAVRRYARIATVYNLTVQKTHTYYVAAESSGPALVHNCKSRDPATGGLDDAAYDRLSGSHGSDVAEGVDYQVKRMHDGSATAGDHEIPGIGHDPDGLGDYFGSWRGRLTHTDSQTGARVGYDGSKGVLVVQNSYMIHGYKFSPSAFASGRYVE
ncbi:polymorphic toxin-type HINT domain-containing protein [Kribbella sp. NPDC003557]|uniref:polymorphic toxin-type HINT domain-containing protein n=1 Tax=Kribbella sp. NPDC003557 TaxID=3154449 RepID=UPI0033BAB102